MEKTEQNEQHSAFRDWYLEGKQVYLMEGPSGIMRLTVAGDRSYLRVKAFRAFPITHPHKYIGFCDDANKEIGIVRDPKEMDHDSQKLLNRALRQRYLAPKILNVLAASEKYGVSNWHVETDRGLRDFAVIDHTENVWLIGKGRVAIQDADGNRFDVPDYRTLDDKSSDLLDRMI